MVVTLPCHSYSLAKGFSLRSSLFVDPPQAVLFIEHLRETLLLQEDVAHFLLKLESTDNFVESLKEFTNYSDKEVCELIDMLCKQRVLVCRE